MHCFFIPVLAFFMTVAQTIPFSDSLSSFADTNDDLAFDADALNLIDTEPSGSTTSDAYDYSADSVNPFIESIDPSTGTGSSSWGGDTQFGLGSDLSTLTDSGILDNTFQLASQLKFDWNHPQWKYTWSDAPWVCPLTPDQAKSEENRKGSTSVIIMCCADGFNKGCIEFSEFRFDCEVGLGDQPISCCHSRPKQSPPYECTMKALPIARPPITPEIKKSVNDFINNP